MWALREYVFFLNRNIQCSNSKLKMHLYSPTIILVHVLRSCTHACILWDTHVYYRTSNNNYCLFSQDKQIRDRGTQPMYLNCDLKTFDLSTLESKFDVIHVTPPLEQYQRRASGVVFPWKPWEWEEVMALKLEEIAAQRSFVFLWCGSAEGLDMGRECFRKWGYRYVGS